MRKRVLTPATKGTVNCRAEAGKDIVVGDDTYKLRGERK